MKSPTRVYSGGGIRRLLAFACLHGPATLPEVQEDDPTRGRVGETAELGNGGPSSSSPWNDSWAEGWASSSGNSASRAKKSGRASSNPLGSKKGRVTPLFLLVVNTQVRLLMACAHYTIFKIVRLLRPTRPAVHTTQLAVL